MHIYIYVADSLNTQCYARISDGGKQASIEAEPFLRPAYKALKTASGGGPEAKRRFGIFRQKTVP